MRLLDVNILVYSVIDTFPQHERARAWLDERLACAEEKVAFPWETITGFVRIVTNAKIVSPPLSVGEAWKQVESWLSAPSAWIPTPTDRHVEYFRRFMKTRGMSSKLVADAQLAALACEHGLTLVSADADFKLFDGLKVENPCAVSKRC